jgi:hypothetical protein
MRQIVGTAALLRGDIPWATASPELGGGLWTLLPGDHFIQSLELQLAIGHCHAGVRPEPLVRVQRLYASGGHCCAAWRWDVAQLSNSRTCGGSDLLLRVLPSSMQPLTSAPTVQDS